MSSITCFELGQSPAAWGEAVPHPGVGHLHGAARLLNAAHVREEQGDSVALVQVSRGVLAGILEEGVALLAGEASAAVLGERHVEIQGGGPEAIVLRGGKA